MSGIGAEGVVVPAAAVDRRAAVLESALLTFTRFGYRKTSMEDVAQAAQISRPGLYFLFSSKPDLFRAAVAQALDRDLLAVTEALNHDRRPLDERLLESFDHWAGRYIGPMTLNITGVIDDNPDLLTTIVDVMPDRFAQLVTQAIAVDVSQVLSKAIATELAQTLISTSIGIKHQVHTRDEYRDRMALAIRLILR